MPTKVILKYILTYFLDCNLINYHSTTEIQLGNHPKYVRKSLKINNLILYIKSTIALVSLWVCFFMFVIIFLVSILFILTICLSSFYAVRPFYFTPIYVFVTILYCPSCLFYPYVCHHFILSVLFILVLCVCHHFILSILFILDHAMFVSGPQYQWQTLPAFFRKA